MAQDFSVFFALNKTKNLNGDYYVAPGKIRISPSAVELARAFIAQVRLMRPNVHWVAVFFWAYWRQMREKGSEIWVDLGTALDLGAPMKGRNCLIRISR